MDEWLLADGRGGFASGTASGERTRRYHALLLTATPAGRFVLVNGLEAWLLTPTRKTPLSTQRYLPDTIYPALPTGQLTFTAEPQPSWIHTLPDGTLIAHDLAIDPEAATTHLRWERLSGTGDCTLQIRLLLSGRDYHSLHHENPNFCFTPHATDGAITWQPYPGLPSVTASTQGTYTHAPIWYRQFLYTDEQARGLDCSEDLASPGLHTFNLAQGPASLVLRADPTAHPPAPPLEPPPASRLQRAAQAYRIAGPRGPTLIAGYPWFTDWGRDTFIAMRGLLLATGKLEAARAILSGWAGAVSEGMLPNRFPDRGEAAEYNAVDASLWFIVAVHDCLSTAGTSRDLTTHLCAACEAILRGYSQGTRFGIAMDTDGLLRAGVPGVQLTWMDAKTGGHVVTPRIGKPVEIQALWINALRAVSTWAPEWAPAAERAQAAFLPAFANPDGGLFDVIDADGTQGVRDASIRPNQIFACGGLPFPVLTGEPARSVVDQVERHLLTPLGLRTLSPGDPAYIGCYRGGPAERDGAYHQGTAWPWLLGPFVDAWLAVRGRTPAAIAEATQRFLLPLMAHLDEAGLGHVSEIVDGDAPHTPGGCPFQAWSLGELIRMRHMLGLES